MVPWNVTKNVQRPAWRRWRHAPATGLALGIYKWKSKFGGLEVSEARRLRSLEDENAKLKKLLAEAMLDIPVLRFAEGAVLKDMTGKKGTARREAACSGACLGGVRAE